MAVKPTCGLKRSDKTNEKSNTANLPPHQTKPHFLHRFNRRDRLKNDYRTRSDADFLHDPVAIIDPVARDRFGVIFGPQKKAKIQVADAR